MRIAPVVPAAVIVPNLASSLFGMLPLVLVLVRLFFVDLILRNTRKSRSATSSRRIEMVVMMIMIMELVVWIPRWWWW